MVSQMIADDVLLCIQMCSDKKCIAIKNEQVCGYLTCIATDEMALKPAIEYASSHGIVGLLEPQCMTYQDVKELLQKSTEEIVGYIQIQGFVMQAREVRVASLDGNVDFPVGVYYSGNKGDASYVEGLFQNIRSTAKKCSSCLSSESSIAWSAIARNLYVTNVLLWGIPIGIHLFILANHASSCV